MLPYGKQTIEADDIRAVVEVLQSELLTTGPVVDLFETMFADRVGTREAVAVNSGTAALHCAMIAAGITAGDEVIVPAITFVATANAVVYCGATPVFADVNESTLLIDPEDVRSKITTRTRAIVAMDYAGQPCDYAALAALADEFGLALIADACHSAGGSQNDRASGSLADFSCFSLHPAKQITAGEGGMVTTDDEEKAALMRSFRSHGIDSDHHRRATEKAHRYSMNMLGFNYRLTDFQCALGLSQLQKLDRFTERRRQVASVYDSLFATHPAIEPLITLPGNQHARHLYVIQWNESISGRTRDDVFQQMRDRGIGVNVHYEPVYRHPYYQRMMRFADPGCPRAEQAYGRILSLPIFPSIEEKDIRRVADELGAVAGLSSGFGSAAPVV